MGYADESVIAFNEALGSKDAVPGGGGASALMGAIGASLASMVGNLTVGKEKYASVEDEAQRLVERARALADELVGLIEADAKAFEPLAEAYSMPKDDPNRESVMEELLEDACAVPLSIMRATAEAIAVHEEMARIGSTLAVSDVGTGVVACKAAMQGASLNVFVNTRMMRDRARAATLESEASELLDACMPKADAVFESVQKRLRS